MIKRIGIDARFLLRPLRGMPLYVTRLCQYLPALTRKYRFYFFINKAYEHNDKAENYQQRLDGILSRYDNVEIVNYNDDAEVKWEQIYLPRLLKEYKIDLLHMPGNRNVFVSHVPTVVTVHDVMEYLYLPLRYSWKSLFFQSNFRMSLYMLRTKLYVWAMYRYVMRRAAKIITVSRYSAGDIQKTLEINPDKIEVIYHGLDEEFSKEVKKKENSSAQLFVLMLGGDSYQKNPEGAILSWANVPYEIRSAYPLKIIGFSGNEQSLLIQTLKRNNLLESVEVKGWVTQNELIEHFQNASLFLCLSRYEGFGFPLLQAMACGTPVISSNTSSLPEVLGEVGLQFSPHDYTHIAKGIEKMLSDESFRKNQSEAGIARSRMFSWERSAEAHMKVYEEVLNK
ncbi:glycosyltransferase family 4 protein [Candidatus Roizmanbacteria bacterium]|nr:glycosyltransferase family 4 protein [Candidatus Roizmanbacteria bacterium]